MATRPFQLLIKPVSADCNLRCEYCFYLRAADLYAEEKRHVMSDESLETMVQGLMQLRFPQSVFAWQGGEPTIAGIDFFRKVVALEQKHGVSGQAVSNAIQTNGLLIDDAWCRLFRDYRFLVGLSIDGPQEVHDLMRHGARSEYRLQAAPSSPGGDARSTPPEGGTPNGHGAGARGTWEKAMAAARLMDQYQVEYNILAVVNAHNVHLGADLARWFVQQGFNYLQFIPCLEPGMAHNVPVEAYGDFLCDTFDYWAREGVGRISIRDFDVLLAAHMGMPDALCTYGRKCNNYIVIEHNGDVYPCDFFVYDEWKLGNITEAPLESFLETEKYRQFSAQKQKVAACAGCTWRTQCYGGCQKDRMAKGSTAVPTPFCAAYKRFFAHAAPKLSGLAKKVRKMQG